MDDHARNPLLPGKRFVSVFDDKIPIEFGVAYLHIHLLDHTDDAEVKLIGVRKSQEFPDGDSPVEFRFGV